MHTTTHNAAREAVQAKPCQNCRDNFPLPEAEDVFDERVVQGYVQRRRACTACPNAAKPCLVKEASKPQGLPTLQQLVLEAQDHTESLRTVLRACHATAALAAGVTNPHTTVSMEGLGELLHLHSEAMERCLDAIDALIETTRATLFNRPVGDQARSLALNASDQLANMRQVQLAQETVASMLPYANDTLAGENLAATQCLLADAMAERTAVMDDMLDALHAALVQQGPAA